ncbi:alpha-E domain-containing protein [Alcanivorax sp. JB21]|uniref:alpha-E domain-containing protein n=1 Tax=Alcanivorax limicola TaxID=2874102 RepID=UPI001CBF64D3|nr:alpha-E domain-containing protein [Alcanivorax limicola]MBZ2187466.1 alpha-E domain-containing protein [Alcanivorax limicola]
MLSRTASELYWMSRHLERAENAARMLDVAWNLSLIPFAATVDDEVAAPLKITGTLERYIERYDTVQVNNVLHFFSLDEENPGSIYNCIRTARENAHAVRGRITSEVWESINTTWIELQNIRRYGLIAMGASAFMDWVKERSHLFRGAAYGTMIRNDAFRFIRIGTFIERADNTARILDVKHQIHAPGNGAVDYYRWNALLRSVGAYEAYRELYTDRVTAENVADMLIFRAEMPRSLRSCVDMLCELLPAVEGDAGLDAKRLAAVLYARLQYGDIGHVFSVGLHEYLTDFLRRINELADNIQSAYLELM